MRLVSLIKSIGYASISPLYALVSAIKIAVQIIFNPRSAAQINHPKQKILLEERLLADKKRARIAPNQNRDNREHLQIEQQQDGSSTQNEDNLDSSIIPIPQKEDENNGYIIMPNIHKKTDDVTDQNGERAIESKQEAQLQDIDLLEGNRTTLNLYENKDNVISNIYKNDGVTDQNDELATESENESRDIEKQREEKLKQLYLIYENAMKATGCKPAPIEAAKHQIEKLIKNICDGEMLASYNVHGAFLLQEKCQYKLATPSYAYHNSNSENEEKKFIFWNNMLQKWYPLKKDYINSHKETTDQLAMIDGYINNFYLPAKKTLDDLLKSSDNGEKAKNAANQAWKEFTEIDIKKIKNSQFKMNECFNKYFQN
ncbi:MAG: hypothetical protein QRY74_01970 [Chlamydia sp.]